LEQPALREHDQCRPITWDFPGKPQTAQLYIQSNHEAASVAVNSVHQYALTVN